MGQYFLIVNPAKKQFLHPHKFGAGLKLMEFTNTEFGPQQALAILLSNGNGNGGGDLSTDNLTAEEVALIGSWAGDVVIVAGDYGEAWKFFDRAEYDGKTYEESEDLYRHQSGKVYPSSELPSGSSTPTGKSRKVTKTFGMRQNRDTKEMEACDENLYSVASTFFEDISDKVIAVVAKGENGYHPWAAIDLKDERGWRRVPQCGVLPEVEPKKPAGGKKAYNAYKKHAVTPVEAAAIELERMVQVNPAIADVLLALVTKTIKDAKKVGEEREAERKARGW